MDCEIYHKRRTKLGDGDDFLLRVRDGVRMQYDAYWREYDKARTRTRGLC